MEKNVKLLIQVVKKKILDKRLNSYQYEHKSELPSVIIILNVNLSLILYFLVFFYNNGTHRTTIPEIRTVNLKVNSRIIDAYIN